MSAHLFSCVDERSCLARLRDSRQTKVCRYYPESRNGNSPTSDRIVTLRSASGFNRGCVMYPLKAILVGEASKLDSARQQLQAHTVDIEAALPDADAAIAWLSQAPEARRLFVSYLGRSDQLDGVKRLRSTCVGQPLLGVVGDGDADKALLIGLMRAGIDQAVLLPLHSNDFRAALESLAWQF